MTCGTNQPHERPQGRRIGHTLRVVPRDIFLCYNLFMNKTSFHILRVGLAITFLWIGILILKDPAAWSSYINSWATNLLASFGTTPIQAMISTAYLDIAVGALLLINRFIWLGALIGALHIVMVLVVSGINEATVRDIAILGGTIAIFYDSMPEFLSKRFRRQVS